VDPDSLEYSTVYSLLRQPCSTIVERACDDNDYDGYDYVVVWNGQSCRIVIVCDDEERMSVDWLMMMVMMMVRPRLHL